MGDVNSNRTVNLYSYEYFKNTLNKSGAFIPEDSMRKNYDAIRNNVEENNGKTLEGDSPKVKDQKAIQGTDMKFNSRELDNLNSSVLDEQIDRCERNIDKMLKEKNSDVRYADMPEYVQKATLDLSYRGGTKLVGNGDYRIDQHLADEKYGAVAAQIRYGSNYTAQTGIDNRNIEVSNKMNEEAKEDMSPEEFEKYMFEFNEEKDTFNKKTVDRVDNLDKSPSKPRLNLNKKFKDKENVGLPEIDIEVPELGPEDITYTWRSNDGACKECAALDGQTFDSLEDASYVSTHPNCQCEIEKTIDYKRILDIEKNLKNVESEIEKKQTELLALQDKVEDSETSQEINDRLEELYSKTDSIKRVREQLRAAQ